MARVDACRVLMGKPDGKRLIGQPSRRWENNIRVDLKNLQKKHGFD
jgi:hypothetical protein